MFNQPVDNLPNSLKSLTFGSNFNQPLNNIPDSVSYLELGRQYSHKITKFPSSLKKIKIPDINNYYYSFPNNIEIIDDLSSEMLLDVD